MFIPRHRPIRLLGKGGMGAVWLAERISDVGASKLVALKVITLGVSSPEDYETFLREARVSMSMNHPNVLQVFDAGVDNGDAWLDLEYIEGVDLARVAAVLREEKNTLSEVALIHLARSLLRALAHAHGLRAAPGGAGVVHRDLSPQNVMVSLHGQVKLTDFGIARIVKTIPSTTSPMGKVRYMAPEQTEGRATPQSDLFGAGAVLHEVAGGRKFRDHVPAHAMLGAALQGLLKPISRPLSPAFQQLLQGLIAADPRQRFSSAEAALAFMENRGLQGDATQEWASLSARAAAAIKAPMPDPAQSEQSIPGEATEHVTGTALPGTPADAPTRTSARKRSTPSWAVPLAVLGGLAVVAVPAFLVWQMLTPAADVENSLRPATPEYEFNTGLPACDEMLEVFSRCESEPGKHTYSEPMLRGMEANFQRQKGMDPASAAFIEASCAEPAAMFKDSCPER